MNFETVIGIELHCELKTKTKMFSSAPVSFGARSNSCVNEIDLGHPGTLPCLNKKAVELAIRACTATNCTIDSLVKFDRKNYYYTDLPKGFQITQQFHPIGSNGYVIIDVEGEQKKVRLNRIHMEEDTAKQFHYSDGTYVDYNRSGIPLIEIVTEADMRSGKEAAAYVEKMRNILYYLGVSDGKMEEGSMRCDVNISIRPYGSEKYGDEIISCLEKHGGINYGLSAHNENKVYFLGHDNVIQCDDIDKIDRSQQGYAPITWENYVNRLYILTETIMIEENEQEVSSLKEEVIEELSTSIFLDTDQKNKNFVISKFFG